MHSEVWIVPLILFTLYIISFDIRRHIDKVSRAQEEKADELLGKFQELLNDSVGTLQQGIDDLKKQQNRGDRE